MKRICVFFIVIVAMLALIGGVAFADERPTSGYAGDTVTWVYDKATATLTFSGTGTLESRYTTAKKDWYSWSNEIKYAVVEEGIEVLYGSVFLGLEKMEKVSLPGTLKSIGNNAFLKCYSLKEVVVPEGVTTIGNGAFKFCESLESIQLPESLEIIEHNAFEGCTSLRAIDIPDKVQRVEMSSFADCTGLVCMTFGKGVQYVGSMSQTSESRIRTFIFTGSAPQTDGTIFYAVTATVYYPAGDNSWDNWYEPVMLDNTIKMVPVEDPAAIVPNLALDVYEGFCGPDANWTLRNGVLRITGQGAITSRPWHFIGKEVNKIVIEDGITSIEAPYLFYSCLNVEDMYISKTMKQIVESAFLGCGMKSVVIPGSLKVISESAFSGCSRLESVVISEGVETIGERAFEFCDSLTSVEMPNSLGRIESGAFMGCDAMKTLVFSPNVKFIGKGIIGGMQSLEHIYFTGEVPKFEASYYYQYTGFTVHVPSYLESWKSYKAGEYRNREYVIYVVKYDCAHSCDKWTNADGDKHTAKCSNCGQTISASHTWTEKSVDKTPTCTEAGSKTMQCKTCGATKAEPIEPTGHAADRSLNYQQNETHHWKDCLVCGAKVDEQEHQGAEECEVCRYKPEPTPTPEPTIAPTPESTPAPESTAKPSATPIPEAGDKGNTLTPDPSQDVGDPKPEKNEKLWIIVVAGVVVAGAAVAVPILLKRKK